jgi:hypothetical protein
MSVTVNDFRKHREQKDAEETAKAAEKVVSSLLEQTASPDATTGDDRLDKMVRALQAVIDALTPQLNDIAHKAMAAPNHDMLDMCRREYWFKKGQQVTLQEAIKIPAQIVMEEKGK